jgi:G3E family GTPase
VAEALSFRALRSALAALPATIYRAKGVVYVQDYPDNQCVLHVVGRRVMFQVGEAWADRLKRSRLVFIGENGGVDPALLEPMFDACRANRAAASETSEMQRALNWLRAQPTGVTSNGPA